MNVLAKWKRILVLGLPSLFAFATQTVTGTVSLVLLGKLGYLIIAVVGVSNIIMYNAFAAFSGIGHTVNYLVAQNYGAQNMRKGVQRMYMALCISASVALLISAAGRLGSESVLRLTGASPELLAAGIRYLELRFYAMSFGIVSFVFHGFFRGVGRTKTSMLVSVAGNAAMVALTYALAYGKWGFPDMGLVGAGYAFLFGEALQLAICLAVFWGPMNRLYRTRTKIAPSGPELRLMLAESGKLGLMEFSMSVSMYIFTMFVARLGDVALAANEVSLNIMSFGFMPAFAFGSTATILVGQELGRRRPDRARRAGTDTAVLGSLFLLALGTVEAIWAEPIARIYTEDPAVYLLAARLIGVSAFLQIFDGLYNFFAGGLRGIGDTAFLMRASLALNFLLFVPLTYLFVNVFHWGSMGAWLALYGFLTALGTTVLVRYYRTDWNALSLKEASGSDPDQPFTITPPLT
jgi:putative MATE family efflux protein